MTKQAGEDLPCTRARRTQRTDRNYEREGRARRQLRGIAIALLLCRICLFLVLDFHSLVAVLRRHPPESFPFCVPSCVVSVNFGEKLQREFLRTSSSSSSTKPKIKEKSLL